MGINSAKGLVIAIERGKISDKEIALAVKTLKENDVFANLKNEKKTSWASRANELVLEKIPFEDLEELVNGRKIPEEQFDDDLEEYTKKL